MEKHTIFALLDLRQIKKELHLIIINNIRKNANQKWQAHLLLCRRMRTELLKRRTDVNIYQKKFCY